MKTNRVKVYSKYTACLKQVVLAGSLLTLNLLSCSPPPDTFGKLDLKKWRGDRGGCNGVRTTLIPAFKAEIQNLKGNSANTIGELLGRPDINQIADRNQKFYIYFLEKGTHCDKPSEKSNSPSVAIRMSAIGLATEITFQDGTP
ncbi:hypothetical protein [Spirosoma utsteinense]|uniref:Lipoprotein SmpA/OmlA domain-containing protein n=1 Tax=Spirosoma utsteinense TaxID=2585773 RepID=A0ABR6W551_9BACT|nr:hypothetical protein [Spirosoma utsteinense]MBC3788035.1 hypothetical protein [Spirosoma utsteinense]MBC3791263.1 hypothetical protein [Spirosoma utsteinense]